MEGDRERKREGGWKGRRTRRGDEVLGKVGRKNVSMQVCTRRME